MVQRGRARCSQDVPITMVRMNSTSTLATGAVMGAKTADNRTARTQPARWISAEHYSSRTGA